MPDGRVGAATDVGAGSRSESSSRSSSNVCCRTTIVCMSPSIPRPSICVRACAEASSVAVLTAPVHAPWPSATRATTYAVRIARFASTIGRCLARRPCQRSAMALRQVAVNRSIPKAVNPNSRTSLALSWSISRLRYHRARRRRRSRKICSKICWEYADQVRFTASVVASTASATHHDQAASTTSAARPQRRYPTTCQVLCTPRKYCWLISSTAPSMDCRDVGVLEVLDAVGTGAQRGHPLEEQRCRAALLDVADDVDDRGQDRLGDQAAQRDDQPGGVEPPVGQRARPAVRTRSSRPQPRPPAPGPRSLRAWSGWGSTPTTGGPGGPAPAARAGPEHSVVAMRAHPDINLTSMQCRQAVSLTSSRSTMPRSPLARTAGPPGP